MAGTLTKTLAELADLMNGRLEGPGDLELSGIQSLDAAGEGEISFAVNLKLAEDVRNSRASAFILPEIWPDDFNRPSIRVRDPYLGYALATQAFNRRPFRAKGIDPGAVVGERCTIPDEITVMAGAVIGNGCTLEAQVTIYPGVVLGENVTVGQGTTLYPNVVIYDGCTLGKNIIIHAGTIIGGDGFGYARNGNRHEKILHAGTVVIEDDVEIGANSTIDRAALGETRIRRGTKIDNLVMIAHNVQVGQSSIIVSQVGISGSSRIGNGVVLAGQVGVVGHVDIGDGSMVGAKSGVAHSLEEGSQVSGIPAIPHATWLRAVSIFKRLPDMAKEFRELKKRLAGTAEKKD